MTRKRSPMVGVFVPRCADDGSYARTQCHGSTGFCWCADKDGKKFPETSIRGKPDCKGIDEFGSADISSTTLQEIKIFCKIK